MHSAPSLLGVAVSRELLAAAATDGTVQLWNVRTHAFVTTLRGHGGPVMAVAFHPSATMLATGSGDGTAKVWSIADRTVLATLTTHHGTVWSAEFSADGVLATSGDDGSVFRWDLDAERVAQRLCDLVPDRRWPAPAPDVPMSEPCAHVTRTS